MTTRMTTMMTRTAMTTRTLMATMATMATMPEERINLRVLSVPEL